MKVCSPESRSNANAFAVIAASHGEDWSQWLQPQWSEYYKIYSLRMKEERAQIAESQECEGNRI